MLCIIIDGKRAIFNNNKIIVIIPNDNVTAERKIEMTLKILRKNDIIALIHNNQVSFRRIIEFSNDKLNDIHICLSDDMQYFRLNDSFKIKNLIFRTDNPEVLVAQDQRKYLRLDKIKSQKEEVKGYIHGHGKMRRENLEASYTRTEDYIEKLRAEG